MRRRDGSGKDLAPMDLKSMFASSDSTESTVQPSSCKAELIMITAFTSSTFPKHHPLFVRVSNISSVGTKLSISALFRLLLFDFDAPLYFTL